ncbi:MAG: transketolase [Chloroflexota bacterium]|nr:transketolase [Chloroflexota bacterium]
MATTIDQTQAQTEQWHALAQQLRVDSVRSTSAAGSGHPTSSLSGADLMAVLIGKYLKYDWENPENPGNDHLIFSKGHASPLLYAMYKAVGAISDEEMMTFRKFGSRIEGHPTPVLPYVDVATGSLGQGLPQGVGIAIAGKYLDKLPYKVWVLLGDSEMAEGSIWEACNTASHYELDNLIGILDMNGLGQRGPTMFGHDSKAYADRARAFGWHTIEIDGHNLEEIDRAYQEAVQTTGKPVMIVARTFKGRGVSFLEDQLDQHGKPVQEDKGAQAIQELGGESNIVIQTQKPDPMDAAPPVGNAPVDLPTYELGDSIAPRAAYGDALKALGARQDVVVLDAEVSNSTYSDRFAKAYPDRFFEMFIQEQQMVAAAVGLQVRNRVPFASTFAAFLTRAYDFIRMAAVSRANIRLCGSHAGVSIGEDGASQMALEDLAMMRAVHGSTVLYPSDGNQTIQLVAQMADTQGISFIRTTREKLPVLYPPDEQFPIGGSKVVRQSDNDQVTVVAAGITVHEAIKACDQLAGEGINVRLIDLYSVKPVDGETLRQAAEATGGRMVVAEDHFPEGGLGSAVLKGLIKSEGYDLMPLKLRHLAVRIMPTSGRPAELLNAAGIDAEHIANAVRELASQ